MTNPNHTDTSRSGDLVERLRGDKYTCRENMGCGTMEFCACATMEDAADRIEALEAEVERLRLDVEAQEALQVSAYHAGLRAGWNFGVSDDNAGMQAAMANTDHIKELRRIREARAALGEKQ